MLALCVHTVVVFGRPQELKCPNGEPFYENANTVDENVSAYTNFKFSSIWDFYVPVLQITSTDIKNKPFENCTSVKFLIR